MVRGGLFLRPGLAALAAGLLCALALPADGRAASVRVPAEYFGINFQEVESLDAAERSSHFANLKQTGIRAVRINLSWAKIEPTEPAGSHTYVWDAYDAIIADAARDGIRVQPTLVQTPEWNTANDALTELYCKGGASERPISVLPYVDFARAVARRYGPGGDFWRANSDLPALPFDVYEIWNEPNLLGGWCPQPDPSAYARMFIAAEREIHAVDRDAKVMVGGLAIPVTASQRYFGVGDFLAGMTTAVPGTRDAADAVAIHTYPQATKGGITHKLEVFREELRKGRIPDQTPMLVNEIGWPTSGVDWALAEDGRVKGYEELTRTIPRTNCNVLAVLPHTWSSPEIDAGDPEHWFGIADPHSGSPYASARAYRDGIRLLRGELKEEADRRVLNTCPGMPEPDWDAEGVPDAKDYYPIDPGHAKRKRKAKKRRRGKLPALECSVRLTAAWEAIREAPKGERADERAAYRRVRKKCVPCDGKLGKRLRKLEHKILDSSHDRRISRRSKHAAGVKRCRNRG